MKDSMGMLQFFLALFSSVLKLRLLFEQFSSAVFKHYFAVFAAKSGQNN